MNLWLDDVRPAPPGWVWVKTIQAAMDYLDPSSNEAVDEMSLDHDLGACDVCMGGKTVDEWLHASDGQAMPNCSHVGTGYDLCVWMADTGHWPMSKPTVHSMNPVGRDRMRGVIERYFPS